MTSFHVYTHQDNPVNTIENCQLCELAVQNQTAKFLVVTVFVIIATLFSIPSGRKTFFSASEFPFLFLRFKLFGRPPPQMN